MFVKACIQIISSRENSINLCIDSIKKYYTYKYPYPIFVHYFDDIYDRREMFGVEFISVPYNTPSHIKEEELFYHRTNNYAKRFGVERKGYLHMCNFICNMYGYPNTKLHEYDYIFTFDDDSGLIKELDFDPITLVAERGYKMSAAISSQRLKDGKIPQNHIDTRERLWPFVVRFCQNNNIELPFTHLKENTYHYLNWSDGYIIDTKIYKTGLWKEWIAEINEFGGIYKYRWGDNEIMSLFCYLLTGKPMKNLKLVENGYLKQDAFRNGIAPGVKNNEF